MELQSLINLLVGVGVPAVGWLAKSRSDIRRELTDFRLEVSDKYVKHTQLVEIKDALLRIEDGTKTALLRIETKLDGKMDKA